MAGMVDSLHLISIAESHPKVGIAIYALFLLYGISHSIVPENETVKLNFTENPLLSNTGVMWMTQNSTQNLTREDIITSNQSQRTYIPEILSSNSEFSVTRDYTEGTSTLSTGTDVSADFERMEASSVTIETDTDLRYRLV